MRKFLYLPLFACSLAVNGHSANLTTTPSAFEINIEKDTRSNYLNVTSARYLKPIDNLLQQQNKLVSNQNNEIAKVNLERKQLQRQVWFLAYSIIFLLSIIIITLYFIKHKRAQYKAKLYQSSLDLKDKMLADISHELRTPLSVLKLNIEALEHNLQEDKSLAYVKINEKIGQLNQLISDVYQLSQVDNCSIKLNNQVHAISSLFRTYGDDLLTLTGNNKLSCIIDNNIPADQHIYIDKHKLDQIMYNLFKNACTYSDSPGFVRLKLRLNPSQLFIQIDDTSPSVSDADLPHLFERLYRVDATRTRAHDGSGLGLSICASLVKLMQGSICAHKGKHGGLCIRVLLPLYYDKDLIKTV